LKITKVLFYENYKNQIFYIRLPERKLENVLNEKKAILKIWIEQFKQVIKNQGLYFSIIHLFMIFSTQISFKLSFIPF